MSSLIIAQNAKSLSFQMVEIRIFRAYFWSCILYTWWVNREWLSFKKSFTVEWYTRLWNVGSCWVSKLNPLWCQKQQRIVQVDISHLQSQCFCHNLIGQEISIVEEKYLNHHHILRPKKLMNEKYGPWAWPTTLESKLNTLGRWKEGIKDFLL